jgi:hypothetical protein
MTLLTVVKDVCAAVGVIVPTSVFSNITGNRTMQEMLSLANEMAQRITGDTREWTDLRLVNVFNGDGTSQSYPLPANFRRLLVSSNVWRSTSALYPMVFIPDTDRWIQRRALNRYDARGEWTIIGNQFYIQPILQVGQTVTFAYLDKNGVALASGGYGDGFLADGDSFRLDERLLKLGMIWQWKASKGTAYAEDMGTYGDALTYAMGSDGPAPIIAGRYPVSYAARTAYPFDVPTPSG